MRRSASEIIRNLEMRIARLERSATSAPKYDPREQAHNRQSKISQLLRVILDNCPTLNDFERGFINDMLRLLNRRRGIEPSTALSEKQARKLLEIIFKRKRDYKHAVPSLPAGVKFEDEVRRLLKPQPNPNEARNKLIEKAEDVVKNWLMWEGEDDWDGEMSHIGHRYVGMDGDKFVFELSWEGGNPDAYGDRYRWKTKVKVDPTTHTLRFDQSEKDTVVETYPGSPYPLT